MKFNSIKKNTFEIKILGDGPLNKRWKRTARRYGIEHRCTWMGLLSHAEALAQYKWADVFVFTSLRDTCGTVVLEALQHGVPVICLDHQGVGDVITCDSGIKIQVTTPAQVISGLCDALSNLAQNREKLLALSDGARKRSRDFLWSQTGKQIGYIYQRVLDGANGYTEEEIKKFF